MITDAAAREYVSSLRRTNQYRKSYTYAVCVDDDQIVGHVPYAKPSWINADTVSAHHEQVIIIRGRDA